MSFSDKACASDMHMCGIHCASRGCNQHRSGSSLVQVRKQALCCPMQARSTTYIALDAGQCKEGAHPAQLCKFVPGLNKEGSANLLASLTMRSMRWKSIKRKRDTGGRR